jgi:hypothetical protein
MRNRFLGYPLMPQRTPSDNLFLSHATICACSHLSVKVKFLDFLRQRGERLMRTSPFMRAMLLSNPGSTSWVLSFSARQRYTWLAYRAWVNWIMDFLFCLATSRILIRWVSQHMWVVFVPSECANFCIQSIDFLVVNTSLLAFLGTDPEIHNAVAADDSFQRELCDCSV